MKTILIIDDEFGIVDVLTEILSDEGYDVISADNGRTGIEALRARQPHLVILDLMMPLVSGKQVLAFMRAEAAFKQVPVVVMSAIAEKHAFGAQDAALVYASYLRKPFRLTDLISVLALLLGADSP